VRAGRSTLKRQCTCATALGGRLPLGRWSSAACNLRAGAQKSTGRENIGDTFAARRRQNVSPTFLGPGLAGVAGWARRVSARSGEASKRPPASRVRLQAHISADRCGSRLGSSAPPRRRWARETNSWSWRGRLATPWTPHDTWTRRTPRGVIVGGTRGCSASGGRWGLCGRRACAGALCAEVDVRAHGVGAHELCPLRGAAHDACL
jgi:hypothetical protein